MYSQITLDERYTLGILRPLGYRPAVIARVLGRHRSTIGRELRRHRRDEASYRPALARARARARRHLEHQWSPEQLDCDRLAHRLNPRPRKRLGYRTPEECYELQML